MQGTTLYEIAKAGRQCWGIYNVKCIYQKCDRSEITKFYDTKLNHFSFHDKKLKKEEKLKLTTSRREEIIKLKAEINKTENGKTIEKINKTESCLKRSVKLITFQSSYPAKTQVSISEKNEQSSLLIS